MDSDEGATTGSRSALIALIAGSGLSLDLERDRMRFERTHARSHCVCAHRGRYDRDHACMHTRARHTHTIHDDTTGPEVGDCMLVDGGSERDPSGTCRGPPNCRKPALDRLARHSLFDRYMKAQLRLAGGRRKPGRNGLSSDRLSFPSH